MRKTYKFSLIEVGSGQTPIFGERAGNQYYLYGNRNNYPDYLIELYDSCSSHQAIINGKARMIMGKGFVINDELQGANRTIAERFMNDINKDGQDINDVAERIILDKLIFNGVSVFASVNPLDKKLGGIYHMGFGNFRRRIDGNGLIFSKYFGYDKYGRINMLGYLPRDKKHYPFYKNNQLSGIVYDIGYSPGIRIYPKPTYSGSIPAIETDVEIGRFHMNNVKTGFSAGHMLEFFGDPTDEEKEEFERALKDKFTGTLNAGEVFIIHSPDEKMGVKIHPMRPNDLDKQYIETAKKSQQDIFIGHNVTSPFIFGVKTEGQLGGRQEMVDAMNEFQAKYIAPMQIWLSSFFNDLFELSYGFNPMYEIVPLDTGEDVAEGEDEDNPDFERERVEMKDLSKEKKVLERLLNECKECNGRIISKLDVLEDVTDEMEAKLFTNIKLSLNGFEMLLLNFLKVNKKMNIGELTRRFGGNPFILQNALNKLSEDNVLQWLIDSEGNVTITNINELNTKTGIDKLQWEKPDFELITVYRYTGPLDDKTREFCRKMTEASNAGKYWTKEQIDDISKDEDYDVWKMNGGWYRFPGVEPPLNRPKCRHIWQAQVIEKEINKKDNG
jgi:hypothetical protein